MNKLVHLGWRENWFLTYIRMSSGQECQTILIKFLLSAVWWDQAVYNSEYGFYTPNTHGFNGPFLVLLSLSYMEFSQDPAQLQSTPVSHRAMVKINQLGSCRYWAHWALQAVKAQRSHICTPNPKESPSVHQGSCCSRTSTRYCSLNKNEDVLHKIWKKDMLHVTPPAPFYLLGWKQSK